MLLLFACEQKQPRTRTIDEVAGTARAWRPADEPATKTVAAPAAAAAPDILPEEDGPSVQEVTDRTGPDTLGVWQWNTAQWDSLNAEWENWRTVTDFGRFRLVEGHESPRLFYKAAARDSAWTEIDLALPDEELTWGMESGGTDLDTVNLDGRGAAELVLRFHPAAYGSGGGTAWDHVSVLDVSSTPMLIFRVLLAAEDEAFGGYAALHGYKLAPGDQFTGCKRSFKVRRHELVLGPVRTIGNTQIGECTLTQLAPGRYRYHNGKVFRVGS